MSDSIRKPIIGDGYVYYPDLDKNIYYDNYLLENLKIIKRAVHHDRDAVIVVAGDPGSGKSVFAMQLAKFLDPSFNIDNIYFEGEKLIRKLVSPDTKPRQAFIYDEAREGLSARSSMSKQNKTITDCFAEIRQKNLFIIVVLPDFWDLDSNVANKRSRYLFHVYEKPNPEATEGEDPFQRGYVRFFNRKDKYKLYILGKKFHDIWAIEPSVHPFVFKNQYVVDEARYRELKYQALRTNRKLEEDAGERRSTWRRNALANIEKEAVLQGVQQLVWSRVFGVAHQVISEDFALIHKSSEHREG